MINYIAFFMLVALYAKWIFVLCYYPVMSLAAFGKRVSNVSLSYICCFPLRVAEHFLRFGGGDLSSSKSR